ncbi:hypothetical protein TNCV_3103601 [Trichonephila clavipes]|nr:hypothetical protein TNCV_3103601 [Trichonephila clavipes]
MALYRSPLTVTLWPSSLLKKYGPMIPPAHKAHQTARSERKDDKKKFLSKYWVRFLLPSGNYVSVKVSEVRESITIINNLDSDESNAEIAVLPSAANEQTDEDQRDENEVNTDSSRWCGMVVGSGMAVQMTSSLSNQGLEILGLSPKSLLFLYRTTLKTLTHSSPCETEDFETRWILCVLYLLDGTL